MESSFFWKSNSDNELLDREHSMDVLRVLACVGVLFAHAGAMCIGVGAVGKSDASWDVCFIVNQMLKLFVPVFTMITGYFFLKPTHGLTLKKLYGKNILRLAIALVFWTLFYALTVKSPIYPFGGPDTNFWYVGMCIGLYISMPVLRAVAADEKLLSYSCWTWLIIRCYYYIGQFVAVPIVFTDYVFTEFVGYCLWGYYLYKVELSRRQAMMIYFIGIVAFVAMVALPLLTNENVSFQYADPAPILAVFSVFLFAIRHPIKLPGKKGKVLTHFSKATFGIYMVHSFVVMETFSRLYRFLPNPVALIIVSTIGIFVLSYLIVLVIKQIPVLRDWVI